MKREEKKSSVISVKRGSAVVKIYTTPCRGKKRYTISYWLDGTRKRQTFDNLDRAKTEAATAATQMTSGDLDVLELTSADRAAYLRAQQLLAPSGCSIELAASQFAEAVKRLGATPLLSAVDFYLSKNADVVTGRTVPEVVAEFLAAKEQDGLSARYLKTLRYELGQFQAEFGGPITSVRGTDLDAWLRGSGWAPRTRNNLRNSVQMLFNFAMGKRYLRKDHDELDSVAVVNDRDGEIEVFTPVELEEVLRCAGEPMIPFLTLGAFAGIRHAEIQRLEWQDVRFEDGIIEIGASKAKTASRRLVPILPNLKEWLLKHRQSSGLVVEHRNVAFELHTIAKRANQLRRSVWATANGVADEELKQAEEQARDESSARKRISKLRSQKGAVPPGAETAEVEGWAPFAWKHNALRHSFISYRVAETQNVAQVALEAGNSPQMIFKHYRELVRPAEAKAWFAILPGETTETLAS